MLPSLSLLKPSLWFMSPQTVSPDTTLLSPPQWLLLGPDHNKRNCYKFLGVISSGFNNETTQILSSGHTINHPWSYIKKSILIYLAPTFPILPLHNDKSILFIHKLYISTNLFKLISAIPDINFHTFS